MLYPIYVHKDERSAYGAIFPDIPGCFAAADDIHQLPKAAQEAIEAHFGADNDPIPEATTPDAWANHEDYQDGGFWMLVDINLGRVRPRSKRVNISLSEDLLGRIDKAAKQRGQSRSAFLASAAEHEIAEA